MNPSWRDQIEKARLQAEAAKEHATDLPTEPGDLPNLQPETVPDVFPDFQVVRELHRGGQGIVYLAIESATQRKVAIKVLLAGAHASASARKRFDREVQLAARLTHPNIISILRSGIATNDQPFYVMDYCRGLPLDQYVRENDLGVRPTLELMAKVCRAVNHAHQKGVIHRDLKPSNLLVDVEGQPKVLDFGLAKQLAGPEELAHTVTGSPIGTVAFMSPEQVRGNPDEVDTRTDVYALGIILYSIMTGSFPYPVHVPLADVFNHISDTEPRKPSRVWDRTAGVSFQGDANTCPLDHELETILLKSIDKEPDRRYQFAGELGRDIERYLRGEPIEAKGDSLSYRLTKSARKHWLAASVLAGYLLLITAGFLLALWSLRQVREANREESRQRQLAEIGQQVIDQRATAIESGAKRLVREMEALLDGDSLDDTTQARLNYALARFHSGISEFDAAEQHGKRAIAVQGEGEKTKARLLLAEIYSQRGDYDLAEEILRSIDSTSARSRLALVLKYAEKFDESERLYRELLNSTDSESSKAQLLNNLGSLFYARKDYDAAIEELEPAWQIRKKLVAEAADEHTRSSKEKRLLNTQSNLGGCYTMIGDLRRSEPLLEEVVTKARLIYPRGHDLLAHYLLYYGRLKVKQRQFKEAESVLTEAYEINSRHFGADHKWTREVVDWLIELYSTWGKPELAKKYYRNSQ